MSCHKYIEINMLKDHVVYFVFNSCRQDLGVPKKWDTIESWFDGSRGVVQPAVTEPSLPELKNPEISVLACYESRPGNDF